MSKGLKRRSWITISRASIEDGLMGIKLFRQWLSTSLCGFAPAERKEQDSYKDRGMNTGREEEREVYRLVDWRIFSLR